MLFWGDVVLELVLPDVVELQPELIFRYEVKYDHMLVKM